MAWGDKRTIVEKGGLFEPDRTYEVTEKFDGTEKVEEVTGFFGGSREEVGTISHGTFSGTRFTSNDGVKSEVGAPFFSRHTTGDDYINSGEYFPVDRAAVSGRAKAEAAKAEAEAARQRSRPQSSPGGYSGGYYDSGYSSPSKSARSRPHAKKQDRKKDRRDCLEWMGVPIAIVVLLILLGGISDCAGSLRPNNDDSATHNAAYTAETTAEEEKVWGSYSDEVPEGQTFINTNDDLNMKDMLWKKKIHGPIPKEGTDTWQWIEYDGEHVEMAFIHYTYETGPTIVPARIIDLQQHKRYIRKAEKTDGFIPYDPKTYDYKGDKKGKL